jgi:hypothetical protein
MTAVNSLSAESASLITVNDQNLSAKNGLCKIKERFHQFRSFSFMVFLVTDKHPNKCIGCLVAALDNIEFINALDGVCKKSLLFVCLPHDDVRKYNYKCNFNPRTNSFSCGFLHIRIPGRFCRNVRNFMLEMDENGKLCTVSGYSLLKHRVCSAACPNWPCSLRTDHPQQLAALAVEHPIPQQLAALAVEHPIPQQLAALAVEHPIPQPADMDVQEVNYSLSNLIDMRQRILCSDAFDVMLHLEGDNQIHRFTTNQCKFSRYFYHSPDYHVRLLEFLQDKLNMLVVLPVCTVKVPENSDNLLELFDDVEYKGDIQLSMTGKKDRIGRRMESCSDALTREIGEEIGLCEQESTFLHAQPFVRIPLNELGQPFHDQSGNILTQMIDTSMFASILTSELPEVKDDGHHTPNMRTRVVTIPLVHSEETVYQRRRLSQNNEGVVIALIRVREYIQILQNCIDANLFTLS